MGCRVRVSIPLVPARWGSALCNRLRGARRARVLCVADALHRNEDLSLVCVLGANCQNNTADSLLWAHTCSLLVLLRLRQTHGVDGHGRRSRTSKFALRCMTQESPGRHL